MQTHHLEYMEGGILDMDDLLSDLVEDRDKVRKKQTDSNSNPDTPAKRFLSYVFALCLSVCCFVLSFSSALRDMWLTAVSHSWTAKHDKMSLGTNIKLFLDCSYLPGETVYYSRESVILSALRRICLDSLLKSPARQDDRMLNKQSISESTGYESLNQLKKMWQNEFSALEWIAS